MDEVEHEICGNCKKEIPQHNYVMHTAHCARNITLCQVCKEPIPKNQFGEHKKNCQAVKPKAKRAESVPLTTIEKSHYFQDRKSVEDKKAAARKERQMAKLEKFVDIGHVAGTKTVVSKAMVGSTASASKIGTPAPVKKDINKGLLACKYCELELPKLEVEEHENYCGSRTDKCLDCGEFVMFKYKQIHMDSNHGFLKLKDEPGPRPSWDSTTQRSPTRPRPPPLTTFSGFDPTLYSFPPTVAPPKEKGESYKEISRRLDCKTEYIRNLLHDSASITVPLRHNGAVPRNHFNHNKGPAPQPPRRPRNPPTELTIPCEFCSTPIPHEDLIQHESGCRPDLARFTPRRRRHSPSEDDYFVAPPPSSPEVELPLSALNLHNSAPETIPCEFCSKQIPQDDLIQHESGCRPDLACYKKQEDINNSKEIEFPCEICADLIPKSQLYRHQATCNL